VLLVQNKIYI